MVMYEAFAWACEPEASVEYDELTGWA